MHARTALRPLLTLLALCGPTAARRHAFGETGAKITYVLSVIASLGVAAANVTFVGQTIVSLLEANGFDPDEVRCTPAEHPHSTPTAPSTAHPQFIRVSHRHRSQRYPAAAAAAVAATGRESGGKKGGRARVRP